MTWTSLWLCLIFLSPPCFLFKQGISLISKRNFTRGKYHRGVLDRRRGSCHFSMCDVWIREGACLVPRVQRLLVILAKGFVFEAVLNGCFGEPCKVGHCVFCLERRPPLPRTAVASSVLMGRDETWLSSPSAGLQTNTAFGFGYLCSVPLKCASGA